MRVTERVLIIEIVDRCVFVLNPCAIYIERVPIVKHPIIVAKSGEVPFIIACRMNNRTMIVRERLKKE